MLYYATSTNNNNGNDNDDDDVVVVQKTTTTNSWNLVHTDVNSGWMKYGIGIHECDWYFVECSIVVDTKDDAKNEEDDDDDDDDKNQYVVTGLNFSNKDITMMGTLRTELGLLRHLKRLNLSDNRLVGTIPELLYHNNSNSNGWTKLGKLKRDIFCVSTDDPPWWNWIFPLLLASFIGLNLHLLHATKTLFFEF